MRKLEFYLISNQNSNPFILNTRVKHEIQNMYFGSKFWGYVINAV